MVYTVDCIAGRDATHAEKRLATYLAEKWRKEYSQMVFYVNAETLRDPYLRQVPLPRIPDSCDIATMLEQRPFRWSDQPRKRRILLYYLSPHLVKQL